MMDVTKQKDLSGFYRHFLNQQTGEEKIPSITDDSVKIKKEEKQVYFGNFIQCQRGVASHRL